MNRAYVLSAGITVLALAALPVLGCGPEPASTPWSSPTDPTVERPGTDTGGETDSDTDSDVDTDTDVDTDGCDPGPSGAATLERGCGPADGEALVFAIGRTKAACDAPFAPAHVVVTLWDRTVKDLSTEYTNFFILDPGWGQAYYQVSKDGPALVAERVYAVVQAWDGSTIEGHYYMTFEGGDCIKGSFAGPWCDNDPKCG